MASETFENGELLLDVRTKINTNFTTVDQRVDALELVVASLPTTAYQKPLTGIPKTDLATTVQASLNKADTAIQPGSSMVVKPQATATPPSNGDMTFELTSDTSLTIKVRGSDGIVRSAILTLE